MLSTCCSRLCDPARPFTAYSTLLTHYRWPLYLIIWTFCLTILTFYLLIELSANFDLVSSIYASEGYQGILQESRRTSAVWMFALWRHIHSAAQSQLPSDDPRISNQVTTSYFWNKLLEHFIFFSGLFLVTKIPREAEYNILLFTLWQGWILA